MTKTSTSMRTFIFLFFSLVFAPLIGNTSGSNEKPIVIVIPSHNNKDWYRRNLDSVFNQNYKNYRIIYLDDASTDGTGKLVQAYVKEQRQEMRVKVFLNEKRVGALANTFKACWLCNSNEIVAILDGDDWFSNEHVLEKLNNIYADPNVWVTYGQFVYYPCKTPGWAAQVPDDIIERNAFREYPWVTTALRTFYAGLFHKIKKKDLLYQGQFFMMAGDLAYMWPIVEMAGKHSRFIPEVLYVYNVDTGINDIIKNPETQKKLGFIIRERERYTPIDKPY